MGTSELPRYEAIRLKKRISIMSGDITYYDPHAIDGTFNVAGKTIDMTEANDVIQFQHEDIEIGPPDGIPASMLQPAMH